MSTVNAGTSVGTMSIGTASAEIRRQRRVARIALCCGALVSFAHAYASDAKATADPYVINACPDPVDVHLRLAAQPPKRERNVVVGTCASSRDVNGQLKGASALAFTGEHGTIDMHLQMQAGDKLLQYDASAVVPAAAERELRPLAQPDGPAIFISTSRDTKGDYLALNITNVQSRQVAEDIAKAKNLRIAHVELFGSPRVTFKFDEIPTRSVFELLADVSSVDARKIGDHAYSIHAYSPEVKALREKLGKNFSEADAAKLVAAAGNPKTAEDVPSYLDGMLEMLGESAVASEDYAHAETFYKRELAIDDLRTGGKPDLEYVETLVKLAHIAALRKDNQRALELLARAKPIAEQLGGPQSSTLIDVLVQQATASNRLGNKDTAESLYRQAVATATVEHKPGVLTNLVGFYVGAERFDDAEKTQDQLYTALQQVDEISENDARSFTMLEDLLAGRDSIDQPDRAERHYRRLLDFTEQQTGMDSRATANQTYWLGSHLMFEKKDAEATKQLLHYLQLADRRIGLGDHYVAALTDLTRIGIRHEEYLPAAVWWQRAVDLRVKVLGSQNARVVLGLRDLAMLYRFGNDAAKADEADRRAVEAESGAKQLVPDPSFAKLAASLDHDFKYDLTPDIVTDQEFELRKQTAPTAEKRAQALTLAGIAENYAETELRFGKNAGKVADFYERATNLRLHFDGKEQADTIRSAKRLAELYEQSGQAKEAAYTRKRYGLN